MQLSALLFIKMFMHPPPPSKAMDGGVSMDFNHDSILMSI